jgi:hypothetical protein
VAARGARVGEGLARHGDELPRVVARIQSDLEDPVCGGVAYLAVGLDRIERVMFSSLASRRPAALRAAGLP